MLGNGTSMWFQPFPGAPFPSCAGLGAIIGCQLWKNQLAREWYVNNLGKSIFLGKFVLFWLPEDNLAETGQTFSELNRGWDVPKPFVTVVAKAAA
jgi:hypothetical protein